MQAEEYKLMYQAEQKMWWFRAMHLFIHRILVKQLAGKDLQVLDIGCGTGGLLHMLSAEGFHPIGSDYSAIALKYVAKHNKQLVQADANCLPFESTFDLVISVDVLETENINPNRFVSAAIRTLKPGGYGLFVMAAHQWLLSEHDRAVNSVRRYNMKQMRELFRIQGTEILRSTYLFFSLFPLIAARKLLNRRQKNTRVAKSDISIPPFLVNEILYAVCFLESLLLSKTDFPVGSSVLILVRKNG